MFGLAILAIATCVGPTSGTEKLPEIALIIDDIGYHYENGRSVIELQRPFAYSILPFSPHAEKLAHLANALEKDVMVHLPMEADHANHLLGPGALRFGMSRTEIENSLIDSLAAVPHAVGVNNHMGSKLTREPEPMRWLMHAIHERGELFFVDSKTTSHSVALSSALRADIASTVRDAFLDNVQTRPHIEEQLRKLVAEAKRKGHALGIAHPHPTTIGVLRDWEPSVTGVRLVAIGDYIEAHQHYGDEGPAATALRLAVSECGNESSDANPTENPNAQR